MAHRPKRMREHEGENRDAHGHRDNQEGDRQKADSETSKAILTRPERAQCDAMQRQRPAFAAGRSPNARGDRAKPGPCGELTQQHNRAIQGMEGHRPAGVRHDQVDDGDDRVEDATHHQQQPISR